MTDKQEIKVGQKWQTLNMQEEYKVIAHHFADQTVTARALSCGMAVLMPVETLQRLCVLVSPPENGPAPTADTMITRTKEKSKQAWLRKSVFRSPDEYIHVRVMATSGIWVMVRRADSPGAMPFVCNVRKLSETPPTSEKSK